MGVSGLRREELAMLAGLSVEYYSQLERGNLRGVSEAVLESASRTAEDMPEALSGDHSSCEVAGPPRGV